MQKLKINRDCLFTALSFLTLLFMSLYQLNHSSLWFDETIEYYYSKTFVGILPWETHLSTMYERIISTFQPPLYNFLMYFWIKICDTQWWFRFSGVILGLICALGIYKSIEKLWNRRAASLAVILLSFTPLFIYYVQECSEYILMLAALSWVIYTWICLTEKVNTKTISAFIFTAIVCVYSQYGAIFPVTSLALAALVFISAKDVSPEIKKGEIFKLLKGYALALLFAGAPLWFFFMSKQMLNQQADVSHIFRIVNNNTFLWDFYYAIKTTIDSCYDFIMLRFAVLIIVLFFVLLFVSKNNRIKSLILANILCWLFYYFAVKFNFYGYGMFGNRYNLFFLLLWLVTVFGVLFEAKNLLFNFLVQKFKEKEQTADKAPDAVKRIMNVLTVSFLVIALIFCIIGWNCLKINWNKEDIRGAFDAWYDAKGYESNTFVYYAASSGFSYYLEHNDKETPAIKKKNIIYTEWLEDKPLDVYLNQLDTIYKDGMPKEIYFVASHMRTDFYTVLESFEIKGCSKEELFNENVAKLIRFTCN